MYIFSWVANNFFLCALCLLLYLLYFLIVAYIHFYHIKFLNVLHESIYQHFSFWFLSFVYVLNISSRARGVSAVATLMHQCLIWILLHGMIQVKKLGFTVERGNLQCQGHWEKGGHRDPILLLSLADLLALQNDLYSRKGNFAPLLVSLYGTSTRVALSVNGKIRLSWHQAAQISVPAVFQSCLGNTHQLPCT